MELDLLLLPVPVMASKQPQLGSSLASEGPPCVPASHTCLGPAVPGDEAGAGHWLWKPSVAEGNALAAKQAGGSQGTHFR